MNVGKAFSIKILLIIVLSTVLVLFSGCNTNELDKRSEKLNCYDISLSLNPDSNTVSGNMIFTYTNYSDCSINLLKFQLYANAYREDAIYKAIDGDAVNECYPNGVSYGKIDIKDVKIDNDQAEFEICGEDKNILSVTLRSDLFGGDSTVAEITYEITLPNAKHRLGWFDGTYNLANAYPILCYNENGIFIEYPYYSYGDPFASETANYRVTFITPKEYVVAASGDLIERIENDEVSTYIFSQKCIRDFSICASTKFNTKAQYLNNIKINYYYLSDTEADASVALISECMNYFIQTFGNYPYSSYSVVQTELGFAGGMEYPNLVFMDSNLKRDSHNKVIIHETAHQWWYGIVGNDQIRYSWLDEALAEYSTLLFMKSYSQYGNAEEAIKNAYKRYKLYYDVITDYKKDFDTSMDRSLPEFKNNQTYVCMAYLKGLLMFDSLENTMGSKKLSNALRRYFNTAKYSIATPDILISCCEREYGADMKKWFQSWLGRDTVIG